MKFLKMLLALLLLLNISGAFAGVVDHYEVKFSKDTANAGEAVDLTIKAVDENGDIVKDYLGNIIGFSETDDEVELPTELSSDDGYTFTAANEGEMKFENGVVFHKQGLQELGIYDSDANENIIGLGKIEINKSEKLSNLSIEILSPENGLTIGESNIKVSGITEKNHQVLIIVNDNKEFSTISNSEGVYEKEVNGLKTGENIIQTFVLNSDSEKVGTSDKVLIKIDDNLPKLKKITLAPISEKGEVEEGKNIIVNLYATPELKEVSLILNDSIIKLEETESGVYSGNFNAPAGGEQYDISAILKDNLGHNITEKNITKITVKKLELGSAPTKEPKTKTTPKIKDECENIDLSISGIKLVKLKNKSILTWNKVEKADGYKVYKKDKEGLLVEVKDTDKEVFEIEITGAEIKYNMFIVKAYKECPKENGEGTIVESGNLSEATKVQTGPEIMILLLLSLILAGGFIIYKRKISI